MNTDIQVADPPAERTVQQVIEQVTKWLRNELLDYPFPGLHELDQVAIPVEIVPPGQGDILEDLFKNNHLSVVVSRSMNGDQVTGYKLCASGLVGITVIGSGLAGIKPATLIVKPKIQDANLLTMLNYAFVPELSLEKEATIDIEDSSAIFLLLIIYLYCLKHLVDKHGLRKDYIRLEEELRSTVRGRCQLGQYLGRNVPSMRQTDIPCRYWELRLDCEPNRALLWGVEICLTLARMSPVQGLQEHLEKMWDQISHYFAGIYPVPYQAVQVKRFSRTGRFAPYEDSFKLLEFILDNLSFSLEQGEINIKGFALEMWAVFERFVVNALKMHLPGQVEGPQISFQFAITDSDNLARKQNIYLDALIKGNSAIVVDAKWKEAIIAYTDDYINEQFLPFEDIRLKNADLFQALAYGRHKDINAAVSILIYPVLIATSACRIRTIHDFIASTDGKPCPVYLLGIPVGGNLEDTLPGFIKAVKEICLNHECI